jgi:NTE family protein
MIQQAAVPLRIVAARLEDGAAVVFDAGPVVDAVLASAALPGIFPPHRVEGHLYVDGGLAGHAPHFLAGQGAPRGGRGHAPPEPGLLAS